MIEKITLPNGVRIVAEEIPWVRSLAVGIWVQVGSRDEQEQVTGISHFIEHMLFKGTKNRTAKQLAEALDAVGGQLNAFTSKEYTCFYAKVLDDHGALAIDVLSDMFFNSLFTEQDIDKERNVVLEEIKMYEDTPDDLVHDLFTSTLLCGHPLGRPIIGTKEVIKAINRNDVLEYYTHHYVPEHTVIAIAGSLKGQGLINSLKEIFGSWKGAKPARSMSYPVHNAQAVVKTKEIEQVHLCLGTLGLPIDHKDSYVLHCLNSILGGGISSRLFQTIREEQGLAYSVYSYSSAYQDTGLFAVYGGLSQNNLEEFLSLVYKEINNMAEQGVTADELSRSKEQLKGNLFLGLESVSSRMSRIGKSELCLKRIITPEEVAEKINSVTLSEVKRLAGELLESHFFTVSAIGPEGSEEKINHWLNSRR
ncbi:MAG: pitrilysin family protein [Carboxydocellales bacterium]